MSEIENIDPVSELSEISDSQKPKLIKRIGNSRVFFPVKWIWRNNSIWRVTTLISVLLLATLFVETRGPINFYRDTDPYYNGYVEPRDFEGIMKKLDKSVVTIFCDLSKNDGNLGTAWAMDYPDITNAGRSALVTNHHVIEDCIDKGSLRLKDVWGDEYDARIESYDVDNDLALVSSSHKFQTLELTTYPPTVGYWVLAYGTADGFAGSVAVGNILNITTDNDILVTAALSHGNSGGPLVDNEGHVFGVSTSSMVGEQYNIVGSLDKFCAKLMSCEGETYWNWD